MSRDQWCSQYRGRHQEKEEKSGKNQEKEEKSGRKGVNREGSFTLPLLTNMTGYVLLVEIFGSLFLAENGIRKQRFEKLCKIVKKT